jgi:LemA protein
MPAVIVVTLLFLALLVVAALYVVRIYNGLVALRESLGRLFAVAENYPDLKADQGFQHLRTRISELENTIADRRELYNEAVNLNNIRIQTFPDLIVARMFDFKQSTLLEFTEEQKRDVDLGKLFG